jgi:hypothetical protein
MLRRLRFVSCSILAVSSLAVVHGQEAHPTAARGTGDLKTVVVAAETKSESVIAIPPARSATFSFKSEKKRKALML